MANVSVKTGQSNYSAAVKRIAQSHPDLLYIAAYGTEAGNIAKEASSMGTGRCFVDLAAQGPDFVTAAGQSVASACVSSGVPSAQQFTELERVRAGVPDDVPHEPRNVGHVHHYDSVDLLASRGEDRRMAPEAG